MPRRAALAAAAKLRAEDDERRLPKRDSLATKLDAEGKALVALNVEKAAVEDERRTVKADLGLVKYLAILLGAGDQDALWWFSLVGSAARSFTGAAPAGAETSLSRVFLPPRNLIMVSQTWR